MNVISGFYHNQHTVESISAMYNRILTILDRFFISTTSRPVIKEPIISRLNEKSFTININKILKVAHNFAKFFKESG
jgi:hypothetical protein